MIHELPSRTQFFCLRALVLAVAMTLAGCASGPEPARLQVTTSSAQNIDAIAELLNQGDAKAALKLIKSSLKRDPNNASLALLRDSVTRDPVELLGSKSFEYIVQPGDTLAELANLYLGNSLMTYQLARYNGIDQPQKIFVGQRLRIPGSAPQPVRRQTPAAAPSAPAATTPRAQPVHPATAEICLSRAQVAH